MLDGNKMIYIYSMPLNVMIIKKVFPLLWFTSRPHHARENKEIADFVNTGCVHIYFLLMLTTYEDIEEEIYILKMTLKY